MFLGRREDVEDAAADRELAAPLDQVGPAVGRRDEVFDHPLQRALVAGGERNGREVAEPAGDGLQDRPHGGHDDLQGPGRAGGVRVGVGEATQDGQATTDRVVTGREPLVRKGLPTGENLDERRVEERRERGREIVGLPGRRGDGEHLGTDGKRSGQDGQDEWAGARDAGEVQQGGLVADVCAQPPVGMPGSPVSGQVRQRAGGGCGRGHSLTTLRPGEFGRSRPSRGNRRPDRPR